MQLQFFLGYSTRVHALFHMNVEQRTISTQTPQDCLITQVSLFGGGMMVTVSPQSLLCARQRHSETRLTHEER